MIPTTDEGTPAAFYPFFSAFLNGVQNQQGDGGCLWGFGNKLPGATNFGRNKQYGDLLTSVYLAFGGGGATIDRIQMPYRCPFDNATPIAARSVAAEHQACPFPPSGRRRQDHVEAPHPRGGPQ